MAKKIVRHTWHRGKGEELDPVPVHLAWLKQQVSDADFAKRSGLDGYVYVVDVAAKGRGEGKDLNVTTLLQNFVIVYGTSFAIKIDEEDDLSEIRDLVDSDG